MMKNDPHLMQLVPVALSLLYEINIVGLQFRPLGLQESYLLLQFLLVLVSSLSFWSMSFNFCCNLSMKTLFHFSSSQKIAVLMQTQIDIFIILVTTKAQFFWPILA